MKVRHFCAELLAILLLGVAGHALAQDAKKAEEKASAASDESRNWPVKIFQVKYADVRQLARIFNAFGGIINADWSLKVLSVRAPKEVLAAIEESIQRLDVPAPPAKNIALTVYLLIGSPQATTSSGLPHELEPVVKQVKGLFNYQGFRLLETLLMRDREAESGSIEGSLSWKVPEMPTTSYQFRIGSALISTNVKGPIIRINGLKLNLKVPEKNTTPVSQWNFHEVAIATDVDVHEGEKVVVGKANIDNADNALILVLTAQVVD